MRAGSQRQNAAVVLKQNQRAFGSGLCGSHVGGVIQNLLRGGDIDEWVFKQTHAIFGDKDASDGFIKALHGHPARFYGINQCRKGVGCHRHFHVDASHQRAGGGIGRVSGKALLDQIVDGAGIGHDPALEAQFAAQNVGQGRLVGRGGNIVEVHIGAHDIAGAGLDRGLERGKVDVVEFGIRDIGRVVVAAARCRAIADKMLGAGDDMAGCADMVALKPLHLRARHGGTQIGILARAFDNAAPARIAGDVDHRREGPVDSERAGFAGSDSLVGNNSGGIKAGGVGQGHRKHRAHSEHDIVPQQQRDMQPRLFDGNVLVFVGDLRIMDKQHSA